jgi:hypothetical protein
MYTPYPGGGVMNVGDPRLLWHLAHNVFPPVVTKAAIKGVTKAIKRTAEGRGDEIAAKSTTHAEVVEDLRLQDFVEEIQDGEPL